MKDLTDRANALGFSLSKRFPGYLLTAGAGVSYLRTARGVEIFLNGAQAGQATMRDKTGQCPAPDGCWCDTFSKKGQLFIGLPIKGHSLLERAAVSWEQEQRARENKGKGRNKP